ncbi:MAG: hypothetical protein OXI22_22025 [Defluviicoccus sp.]|nr:hypothetical protein [Defluviicoccus sp.]MDE0386573.1 hypothetical protein [Defluviicoccus sp.]
MAETVSVPIFDTQLAVEELVAAGMPPGQAGAVVRMQAQWVDRSFATGEDVERLRTEVNGLRTEVNGLRTDMDRLRGDLEAKIETQGVEIGKDMARLREDVGSLRGDLEAKIETQGVRIAKDMAALRGDLELKIEARSNALERQIAALRGTLEARILASETNTIKWVTGTQVGTSAIFLAALLAALKL